VEKVVVVAPLQLVAQAAVEVGMVDLVPLELQDKETAEEVVLQ
jgi:hypothetical protein